MAETSDVIKEDNHKKWIIEAIDLLRHRKARPDISRICHMVQRKHDTSSVEIKTYLERLVNEEAVIKVDYKGDTSYRNAAKWKKTHFGSIRNSDNNSKKISNAMAVLTQKATEGSTAPSSESGDSETQPENAFKEKWNRRWVTLEAIQDWFQVNEPDGKMKDAYLKQSLEREVDATRLERMQDDGKLLFAIPDPSIAKKIRSILDMRPTQKGGFKKNKQEKHLIEMAKKKLMEKNGKVKKKVKQSPVKNSVSDEPVKTSKSPSPGKVVTLPGKRKRFKKSLGPDFEHYFHEPARKRSRKESSESNKTQNMASSNDDTQAAVNDTSGSVENDGSPRCDFCLLSEESNRHGVREDLLICTDCQAKAHPSCMDYSETLARRARRSPWQCIDCKTCCLCLDAGDADAMLFCDACDKGYHMDCHQPPVKEKPTGKWVCSKCQNELGTSDEEELRSVEPKHTNTFSNGNAGAYFLPTPQESPVSFDGDDDARFKNTFELATPIPQMSGASATKVPDATDWGIEEVVDFLCTKGFDEQAEAFKEQEIDGKSLLLMKRSDVLQGLSIKLGPALKIYKHVQTLQTRGQHMW